MNRTISATLILIVWTSCAIGPDYERPTVPEPEAFRNQPEEAIDTTSLADMPWWELFQDEQLQQLIRIALEENNDLRVAVARIDEARALVGATRSGLFPQIQGEASYSRSGINAARIPGEDGETDLATDLWAIGSDLTWEIDIWGQIRRATEAARAELLASEEARRAVIIRLISDVAQAYFELRGLDLQLEITRQTVESFRAMSRIVTARHEDGLVSGLDKVRAEAEVVRVASDIPDFERQIVQQENALNVLLGRNPDSIPRGGKLVDQTTPPVIPAGLPSSLLERRPDILEAEQNLVAANAEIGVAKGFLFPRITLTGQFGVLSRDFNDLFSGPAQMWGFGPGISLPIFTAGRNLANLDASEARQQQALIEYEQAILQAFREVEDALIGNQKVREVRTQQEKLVKLNQKTVTLAEFRYEEGLSDYIDVLDAQRQLFVAQIDLAETLRSQFVVIVRLYKALGGGWTPEPPTEEKKYYLYPL